MSYRSQVWPRYPRRACWRTRQRGALAALPARRLLLLPALPAVLLVAYRRELGRGAALAIGFMLTTMLVVLVALRLAWGLWLWEVS